MVLGFFNGCVLRYRASSLALTLVAGFLSAFLCCCIPMLFIYRWVKSIMTPDLQVCVACRCGCECKRLAFI